MYNIRTRSNMSYITLQNFVHIKNTHSIMNIKANITCLGYEMELNLPIVKPIIQVLNEEERLMSNQMLLVKRNQG